MADINQIEKMMTKVESQFKFHGMWHPPYIPPPRISIRDDWDESTRRAAEVLNRIFFVRSMPDCSRLFGPVRESAVEAFFQDYGTGSERMDYVRNQLNLLIADVSMIKGLDTTSLSRISE